MELKPFKRTTTGLRPRGWSHRQQAEKKEEVNHEVGMKRASKYIADQVPPLQGVFGVSLPCLLRVGRQKRCRLTVQKADSLKMKGRFILDSSLKVVLMISIFAPWVTGGTSNYTCCCCGGSLFCKLHISQP